MQKLLALNRREIAIRIMPAATELSLRTVEVFPKEDALSLHRFKADEAYQIGKRVGIGFGHTDFPELLPLAKMAKKLGVLATLDHPAARAETSD